MSTIPLPALDLHQQPQPDILGQFGKLQALRSLGQQQQLQQQQIVSGQQDQQLRQQQIQDQQATTAALRSVDPTDPKYKDNPLQYYADVQQNVLKNNGSANAALAVQQHGLTVQKTVSDIAKQDAETGSKKLETYITQHKALGDQIEGLLNLPDEQLHDGAIAKINGAVGTLLDAPTAQQYIQQIQGISDPKQLRTTIDTIGKAALGATNVATLAKTQAETAEQTASANAKRQESDFYNRSGVGAPGVPAEVVQMSDWLRQNPGKTPSDYAAAKAGMVAAAEQPYKIATAEAEGRARQLVEGLGKSVYAFLPDGTHQLMSQTAALQTPGVKAMVPATEKQIGDDIMLNNRLADAQQKINNYDQALSKIGATVSDKDQSNLAGIIGKQAFKVGAFGSEVPVDRLNAALDKENIKGLSDDAVKLLAAYYNARESLVGYNRVLSGSARAGDKQMEVNQDTLPNPGTTDPRYAKESMNQFRQNLKIVGQGLPVIPGIKRPDEWSPAPGTAQQNPTGGAFNWNSMPQHQ